MRRIGRVRTAASARSDEVADGAEPEEGIFLRFATKVPGGDIAVGPVEMDFAYDQTFHGRMQDAYTRLLLDALRGDPTLFTRADEAEASSWHFIDPIRAAWTADGGLPDPYRPGTWGPAAAARLPRRQGHRWRTQRWTVYRETPESTMPWMKYRCSMKKTMNTGTMVRIVIAISWLRCIAPNSLWKSESPSGTVKWLGVTS